MFKPGKPEKPKNPPDKPGESKKPNNPDPYDEKELGYGRQNSDNFGDKGKQSSPLPLYDFFKKN